MKKNKFIRSLSIYTASNIYFSLTAFILIPFLTRSIDLDGLGIIYMFQAVLTFASLLVGLGSVSVIQSLYFRVGTKLAQHISSAIFSSFILWLILCILVFFLKGFLFPLIDIPQNLGFLALLLSLLVYFQSLAQGLFQMSEQPRKFFYIVVLSSSTSLIVTLLFLLFFLNDWSSRIIGIGSGLMVAGFIAIPFLLKTCFVKPDLKTTKKLVSIGIPIVFHSFAMLMISQTDKFLIGSLMSISNVGTYGVAVQLASVIGIAGSSLSLAYTPVLFKSLSSEIESEHKRTVNLRRWSIISLFFLGIIILIGVISLQKLILGESFNFNSYVFTLLVFANIFFGSYHFYSGYFYHYKRTITLATLTFSIGVLNFFISYFLIPIYGIIGASVGTLISYCLALMGAIIFAYSYDKNLS